MPLKKYRQYRAPSGFLKIGIHAWHQLSSSFSLLLPSYFFISFPQSVWVVASFVTHKSKSLQFYKLLYNVCQAYFIFFFVLFCLFSLFIELHLFRLVRFPFCFSQLKRILDFNFSINNSNVCIAIVSLDFSCATNKSNKQISNEREDEIEKGHRFHGVKSVNSAKVSLFHPFCVCMSA